MNNTIKKIIKCILAGVLVWALILSVNWRDVWAYMVHAHPYFIGLFVVFYILGIMISARKWEIIARFVQFSQKYSFYLKTYLLGTFLNNFFPSFIGGDTYRAVTLSGEEKRIAESSATVVIDRVSGLFGIIFVALVCGGINKVLLGDLVVKSILLALGIIFIIFVLSIIFFRSPLVQKMITILPRSVQKYIGVLLQFHDRSLAVTSFLYSLLFSFVGIALANYMLFYAVGVEISFAQYVSVVFLTNLIASLPISIGNVGTKEWAYIVLFGIFGVSVSALVAIVLLSRALQMIVSLVALPLYFQERN